MVSHTITHASFILQTWYTFVENPWEFIELSSKELLSTTSLTGIL